MGKKNEEKTSLDDLVWYAKEEMIEEWTCTPESARAYDCVGV